MTDVPQETETTCCPFCKAEAYDTEYDPRSRYHAKYLCGTRLLKTDEYETSDRCDRAVYRELLLRVLETATPKGPFKCDGFEIPRDVILAIETKLCVS